MSLNVCIQAGPEGHGHSKGRTGQGYWRLVWRQFRKNRTAVPGVCAILLLGLVAVAAPFLAHDRPIVMKRAGKTYWFPNIVEYRALAEVDFRTWQPGEGEFAVRPPIPYAPESDDLLVLLEAPSRPHYLGTDDVGRDVLSRLIWGTRISMSIGFVAVGISAVIGILVGMVAGYYGGWVDNLALRVVEVMMCFPVFILILALLVVLPQSIFIIMFVLGITGWTGIARLVRGEFLKLRESEFAAAAQASGLSDRRVMLRHLLPNALAPVLVSATFGVAGAILTESALSFLGFGVPPNTASWGELLRQSNEYINSAQASWWLATFPGGAIFLTVTAFNLVGEGLRDAMDPRLRQ